MKLLVRSGSKCLQLFPLVVIRMKSSNLYLISSPVCPSLVELFRLVLEEASVDDVVGVVVRLLERLN